MNLKYIVLLGLTLNMFVLSCENDDGGDDFVEVPERDRAEVYAEDIAEIEEFLSSHTVNQEAFTANSTYSDTSVTPAINTQNDSFDIEFEKITSSTSQISMMDMLNNGDDEPRLRFKMVEDNTGQEYKLYYLVFREGLGSALHPLDEAVTTYDGTAFVSDDNDDTIEGDVFDSSPVPVAFNLTALGTIPGVVQGFREGLIQFKTSVDFSELGNGDVVYHNYGIGAIFIPSGLAYFSSKVGIVNEYEPIMFKIGLVDRISTDYDFDNVPSHLEDLDSDNDGFNDDSDGDAISNFLDVDDDGDGVLTIDEDLEDTDLTIDSDGDGDPTNDRNGDGNPLNDDTDGDGIPNYLDADTTLTRL
jgi:FKBP-type peptidyl-prolyl cis-trans isomerase